MEARIEQREIGLAGHANGQLLDEYAFAVEEKQIRLIMMEHSEGYFLPDGAHGLAQKMRDGRIFVHRTNGRIDGFCAFQITDVRYRPYGATLTEIFRLNEIRTLAVEPGVRRDYIAYRLVRHCQLHGTINSPHLCEDYVLRAVATVAAFHAGNEPVHRLAESLNAIITGPEGPVIDLNPALRGYAIRCHERLAELGLEYPFDIAVLRSTDLVEAARLHWLGHWDEPTTEGEERVQVKYDTGCRRPGLVDSAVNGLLTDNGDMPRDELWLTRLGLLPGPDTDGCGTAFFGNVTPEMSIKVAF